MCYPYSDPTSIPRWWASFFVQLHTSMATNWAMVMRDSLAKLHEQRPKDKWRSPLLSLHIEQLKPTLKPTVSEPRRDLWLVK